MRLSALDQRLGGQIQKLYQAHLERAARIDWSYHQFLPQDLLNGTATEPPPKLSPRVYCAIETALLTEVNLPWFTTELHRGFIGSLEVMLDFVHAWTAEEDQVQAIHQIDLAHYRRTADSWLSNMYQHKQRLQELVGEEYYRQFRAYLKLVRRTFSGSKMTLDIVVSHKI